jgi:hypothetical protein
MVLSSTYQSTDNPLLSTLYEPLSKHLITVLGLLVWPWIALPRAVCTPADT